MKNGFALLSLAVSLAVATGAEAQLLDFKKAPNAEASEETRAKVVAEQLKTNPTLVLVYAKGLCCPSCAIGIRKMVSGLGFVDSSGDKKGVELDPKHQLVSFKIKDGQSLDQKKLIEAIDNAGYDPVRLYRVDGKKVVTNELAQAEQTTH